MVGTRVLEGLLYYHLAHALQLTMEALLCAPSANEQEGGPAQWWPFDSGTDSPEKPTWHHFLMFREGKAV